MNFSRLSKEKRNQLILVLVGTAAVLSLLGLGLIRYQRAGLKQLAEKREAAEKKLKQMEAAVTHASQTSVDLAEAKKNLAAMEGDIASGDLYAWLFRTI